MTAIRLVRETLYSHVWSRPIGYLARDLGVTAAKLREVCKLMEIPVPASGYWAAVRAGTAAAPVPLPAYDGPTFLTVEGRPPERLAEWVSRTTPPHPAAKSLIPRDVKLADSREGPRLIPLRAWANLLLGAHAPHYNTLLRWLHEGRIQPQPKKIGRRWFVSPNADYIGD